MVSLNRTALYGLSVTLPVVELVSKDEQPQATATGPSEPI